MLFTSFDENDIDYIMQLNFHGNEPNPTLVMPQEYLQYGLKYCDDNYLLIERKPQTVYINYDIYTYAIKIPWSLYLFTVDKEASRYNMQVFFSDRKLLSLNQNVSDCWLHNINENGYAEVNKSSSVIHNLNTPDLLYQAYLNNTLNDMIVNFWNKKFYFKYSDKVKHVSKTVLDNNASIPKFLKHLSTLGIPEIVRFQSENIPANTTIQDHIKTVEQPKDNQDTDYDLFELVLSKYVPQLYHYVLFVNKDKVNDKNVIKLTSLFEKNRIKVIEPHVMVNRADSLGLLEMPEEEIEPESQEDDSINPAEADTQDVQSSPNYILSDTSTYTISYSTNNTTI